MAQGEIPPAFRKRQEAAADQAGPDQEQVQAAFEQAMRQQTAWRPACANCANTQKLAFAVISKRLEHAGYPEHSQEWVQAMMQAQAAGQEAVQSGQPVPEGALPPVRPADMLVSGNSLCFQCLQPSKATGLIVAPAGMSMSGLLAGR